MSEDEIPKVKIINPPKCWDDVCKPLTANVTESEPLVFDLHASFCSGHYYLASEMYAKLEEDYNVKFIRPLLMRDPSMFYKSTDYRYLYDHVFIKFCLVCVLGL